MVFEEVDPFGDLSNRDLNHDNPFCVVYYGEFSTILVCRTTWGSENWSAVSVTFDEMLQMTAPDAPA